MDRITRRTNRLLLLEIVMVLTLVVLSIVFYLRPVADRAMSPEWWRWVVLVGLFFAVVGLDTWRRRHAGLSALHEALREGGAGPD